MDTFESVTRQLMANEELLDDLSHHERKLTDFQEHVFYLNNRQNQTTDRLGGNSLGRQNRGLAEEINARAHTALSHYSQILEEGHEKVRREKNRLCDEQDKLSRQRSELI